MKKYLFISKKKKYIYYVLVSFLLLIFLIYSLLIYLNIQKKFFIITNLKEKSYYIIPKDKEGKKVDFLGKKSINNLSKSNEVFKNFNLNNLNFTIQLFSDLKYENIDNYIKNKLEPKSNIISMDELFIFSITSQIGIDYFLTYKNFNNKNDAMNYCKKLSFVKKCLILNPKINNF